MAIGTVLEGIAPPLSLAFMGAGEVLFENLGLIFGVGIAVGLSGGEGIAGLGGGVAYLLLSGIAIKINPENNLGVIAGIIAGLGAAWIYERFSRTKLPEALSFFAGQRWALILTTISAAVVALPVGYLWPAAQAVLSGAGEWMTRSGVWGVAVYGALERLLIPTGLHHFLNGLVLLTFGEYSGATGDLGRFFAGDPSAGFFMAGAYPIKIFALPAACLAMYHEARADARRAIKGLMVTAALTSILTGITEPVEFTFLFTAPILYLAHAGLTGLSFAAAYLLEIRHGFASSAGILEFLVNSYRAENPWLLIPLGLAFGAAYYLIFRWVIRRFRLPTPGRLAGEGVAAELSTMPMADRARWVLQALGGSSNLKTLQACLTRLRITFVDEALADEDKLRDLGASGIIKSTGGVWQVVFGPTSGELAREIKAVIRSSVSGREPAS
jgi:PTS system N-acetylglucosamine-specific IIC component